MQFVIVLVAFSLFKEKKTVCCKADTWTVTSSCFCKRVFCSVLGYAKPNPSLSQVVNFLLCIFILFQFQVKGTHRDMEGRGEGEKSVWYFRGRFGWSRGRARGRELWQGRGVSEEPAEDHAIRGRGISRGDRRERGSSAEYVRGRSVEADRWGRGLSVDAGSRGDRQERGSSAAYVRGRSVEADRWGRCLSVDAGSIQRRLSVDLSGSIFTDPNLPPRALGHANIHVELSKKQQQERKIKELRRKLAEKKPILEAIDCLLNDREQENQAELSKEQQQERETEELKRTLAEKKLMLEAIDRLPNDRKQKNQAEEGSQAAKDKQKKQAEEGSQAAKDEQRNQAEEGGSQAAEDEEYKKLD